MRTFSMLVSSLLLLLIVGIPAFAKEHGAPADPIKAEYDKMAKLVTLTADQQPKFDAAVAALDAAVQDWDAKNGAQLKQLKEDQKTARQNNDKDKAKEINGQIKQLNDQLDALEKPLRQAIMDVLTPEQKHTLGVAKLTQDVDRRYGKLTLTDEQKTKIKALVDTAVTDREKAADGKAREAVTRKLFSDIETNVLTVDQQEQLKAASTKRKADAATTAPAATTTAPAK